MKNKRFGLIRNVYKRLAFWLACLAALAYSSWPLGYVLNPSVGRYQLASQLESPHQPFNWLFITTDVLTGLFIVIVGALQLRSKHKRRLLNLCISGYILFGLLVAITALVPINCDPTTTSCGPLLHDPKVVVHGLASILSVLCLFASTVIIAPTIYLTKRSKSTNIISFIVLSSWIIFGVGALIEIYLKITGNTLQYFFITVCSLSIIFVISSIEHIYLHEKRKLAYEPVEIDDNL